MRWTPLLLIVVFLSCSSRFTYEDAEKKGTIDAYYRFITENPNSSECELASSKIRDMLFSLAVQKRDVILIKKFLSEFSGDQRSQTLRELLEEIRFAEAKKMGSRAALDIFIRKTSSRKLREEAENLLEEIEYKEVEKSKDVQQIETFLQKYPGSYYYTALNERVMQLLYERIKGGELLYSFDFVSRFPESGKVEEINRLLVGDVLPVLSDFCLLNGTERISNQITGGKASDPLLSSIKEGEKRCSEYYNRFVKISSGKGTGKEVDRIFSKDVNEKERTAVLNLLKNYLDSLLYLRTMTGSLQSEDPEKRRASYLYIKSFPQDLKMASDLVERFMNSTLYERIEISQIIRSLVEDEQNKRIFNLIFFLNRDKPLYGITHSFFLKEQGGYEKENTFLNRAFSDSKEDILLQHLIVDMAFENGYNSFVKSVANEHIRQLFSVISEFQSLCQEECSKRLLFEIKGVQQILLRESDIFKTVFGENSELTGILTEKGKEISSILDKYKFAPEQPVIRNPSEGVDIEMLSTVSDKSVLLFVYQAEPDKSKREKIKKLLSK